MDRERSPESHALLRAIKVAGSQSAFGRLIGRNQSTVHDWVRLGRPLPPEYVLKVEELTGVSRHDLRPDIYPLEPASAEEAA